MTFIEFKCNVELWAAERGIYDHSTTEAQLMKALSELGELADAIIKGDDEAMKDAVGDVAVCIVNAAYLDGVSLDEVPDLLHAICADSYVIPGRPAYVVGWIAAGLGSYLSADPSADDAFIAPFAALNSLCAHKDLDFMVCCKHAWNEIKDRKGRMVAGGAFVKDEDEQKQDGGPELPESEAGGVTMRDYFAAKAMQGIITSDSFMPQITSSAEYEKVPLVELVAGTAYAIADAMLKECEK